MQNLKNDTQVLCAGMPGIEPRTTESESVVLPVTPHPNILLSATLEKRGGTEKFSTCCLLDASVVFIVASLNMKAVPI